MSARRPLHTTTLALLAALGCGDSDGEGELTVAAYGESFIEEGIPAAEMADGWTVRFDSFVVALEDVRVAGAEVEVDERVELARASDGQGHPVGMALVDAGEHGMPAFTVTHVEVTGRAEKDDSEKTFAWTFEDPTTYVDCETTTAVDAGGEARFEITVHADHLFYDSLVAEEPALRFQALADADQDDDGTITQAELAEADLGAYDPGSSGDIEDLWAFLEAQVRTLGHVDGEGHCHVQDER